MSDFIPFEIAKKLKEKRFPQHWCNDDYIVENDYEDVFEVGCHYDRCFIPEHLPTIAAPTVSQVLKWLREEKKIHIAVLVITDCSKDADNNICEEWTFWSFYVTNLNDGSTVYDDFEKIDCIPYLSYEQAALAGIEYVLDNLI